MIEIFGNKAQVVNEGDKFVAMVDYIEGRKSYAGKDSPMEKADQNMLPRHEMGESL